MTEIEAEGHAVTETETETETETDEFDVCGPLPEGTVVLEASAGTGKTYTIAALAARYVAEGVATLDQMMLVTFGRMATNELRSRVRERLVGCSAALADALAGRPVPAESARSDPDRVLTQLLAAGVPELVQRRRRIDRALADFDAATIATTHEFCLQMLDGLGVLGDREPQAVFAEELSELTREVSTDLFLARYADAGAAPMTFSDALDLGQAAVASSLVPLVPQDEPAEASVGAERVRFAVAVRREVERRKRAGRLFTFDDMLGRLRDALADPDRGPAAARRVRERYRIVLVDEFQDTDPVQWEILRRAFAGHATLILVGDPKQAIYAFRGADVHSYLDAVGSADRVATLGTNRRSDAALLDALGNLFVGARLGEREIVVRPVRSAHPARRLDSLSGSPLATPIRVRSVPMPVDATTMPSVTTLRPRIVADLVADIAALLASDVELDLGAGRRPLRPADLAVLVRRNVSGETIRDGLVAAGVPAVLHGATSVFCSAMADDWLTLLATLHQPRQPAVRRAALTVFLGQTFDDLATADEDARDALASRVRAWSRTLAVRGVAALLETVTIDTGLPERLLGRPDGERQLTDLRHLGQLLHAAKVSGQLGTGALLEWLREEVAQARHRGGDGTRRLDTDAHAVTVLTVHRSKGLEFPVVYLPEAWDRHVERADDGRVLRLHQSPHPGADNPPVLDVGGRTATDRSVRFERHLSEEAGEDLRLCYVAATRAQCQVVTWWAPSTNTPPSALQRLLARDPEAPDGAIPDRAELVGDPSTGRPLGPAFSLEPVRDRPLVRWRSLEPPAELRARVFARTLDLEWRRTSYSALTAAAHGLVTVLPAVGSEPDVATEDDEAHTAAAVPEVADVSAEPSGAKPAGLDAPSPMGELPVGAAFGSVVHAILEEVDTAAPDLAAEMRRATDAALAQLPGGDLEPDALAAALLPTFRTPLGPLASDRCLADIPRGDRLAELGFEFPLAGGDRARGADPTPLLLGALPPLLRRHLGADDPLTAYADALADPVLADQILRGYLSGSIDAVLRVADPEGVPRFLVVDYKTNWLGGFDGRPLRVGDHTPERMAAAMIGAHYPLQALLYGVAVHRMLRWRLPHYDPDRHLGGVLYLFVRGLDGPHTPRIGGVPCGVFSWRPPSALVVDLSDLLDGQAHPAGVVA